MNFDLTNEQLELQQRVKQFITEKIIPYEKDSRITSHGPTDELRIELNALAKEAGLFAPHVSKELGGMGLNHVDMAIAFEAAGYSPLGPIALHCAAPDEGNMNLLSKVGTTAQKERWLKPFAAGDIRSNFCMTEPGGAGADPSGMYTKATYDGDDFIVNGVKWLITGARGSSFTIIFCDVQAEGDKPGGPTMLISDMDQPGITISRDLESLDNSFTGGHSEITFNNLRIPAENVLGEVGEGFRYVQVRLAPARLTHCMRWLGAARRAHDIACDYARRRHAFGKPIGEHEGIGFMLADNEMELQQSQLMIWWTAAALDKGEKGRHESSMTKTLVSEAVFRIADRCVQVLGGSGVTKDTVVEWVFREARSFRIYDGPSEVHRWAIAKRILRNG
ncbi:acyl-CoA dehydrogenase [Spongiibacter sp. KMU-166]|uniref:Acyl-CoA dehydrogenase n=1 Tax=Spongiibacter thalassae TaxID=2721624 RepID=A0ABX1G9W0_9GAMM|nr:acyl-CoA dehydrogenase [Spongiibacter thalassae]